jgi:protein SCO1
MVKLYTVLGTVLFVVGTLLILNLWNGGRSSQGQAGIAYVEGEDGKLVPASEMRSPVRTKPVPPSNASTVSSSKEVDENGFLQKFTLIERSGKKIASDDLKGQPYVVGFFFSSCPSICVNQNGKIRQLQERFKGQPIRFLSISCDPEVDRPEVLAEYATRFNADKDQWLFLTGDFNYIRRVGVEMFRLPVERKFHPEKFVLMGADGQAHGFYTWSDDNQWLALQSDIEKLVSQK